MPQLSDGAVSIDLLGLTGDRRTGAVPTGTAAANVPAVYRLCSPSRSRLLTGTGCGAADAGS